MNVAPDVIDKTRIFNVDQTLEKSLWKHSFLKPQPQEANSCSRSVIETLEQSVNIYFILCSSGLLLTMSRLLFAGKAEVHLKEFTISEVTDLIWVPLQILFKDFVYFLRILIHNN